MKIFVSILFGFLFAVLIVFLAVILGGAGHGWNGALRYGLVALVACPMVAVSLTGKTDVYTFFALVALLIGAVIDVLLILSIQQEYRYFQKVVWLAIPWIALMISWQILAVIVIIRNRKSAHNNSLSQTDAQNAPPGKLGR